MGDDVAGDRLVSSKVRDENGNSAEADFDERQRPEIEIGPKAGPNAKQRVIDAPRSLNFDADGNGDRDGDGDAESIDSLAPDLGGDQDAGDGDDTDTGAIDLQSSIRSARQLLSLISPSEPGTNTGSSSTEHSNDADADGDADADADADSTKIWHRHIPKRDDSFSLEPPDSTTSVPLSLSLSSPQHQHQHPHPHPHQMQLNTEIVGHTSAPPTHGQSVQIRQSVVYDQPWDDQAKKVQLMINMMQDVAVSAGDQGAHRHRGPSGRKKHSKNERGSSVCQPHSQQQFNGAPNYGTGVIAMGAATIQPQPQPQPSAPLCACGCGQPLVQVAAAGNANASIASFVSPLRQRVSHCSRNRSRTLSTSNAIAIANANASTSTSTTTAATASATLQSGFSYVFVSGDGATRMLSNAAFCSTPTHRRAANEETSTCQCAFVRQHNTLAPNAAVTPCAHCLARCSRQRNSMAVGFGLGLGQAQAQALAQPDNDMQTFALAQLVNANANARNNTSIASFMQPDASPLPQSQPQPQHNTRPLHESRSWYFGALSRNEAENLLNNEPESTFLVRKCESSQAEYAISIRSSDGFVHMKITRHVHTHSADGVPVTREHYVLGSFSQPYDSVADIVRHFSGNTLPVKGIRNLMLKYALHRDRARSAGVATVGDRHERSRSIVTMPLPAGSNTLFRPISAARNHTPTGRYTTDANGELASASASRGDSHLVMKPRFVAQTSLPAHATLVVANHAARN